MPDGHQGDRPPFSSPFQSSFQSPPVLNHPGVTKPNGGVARAIALARGLSGKAAVLVVIVFGLQAVMPAGSKPSDLIGSFHGKTETAEILAKQKATVKYERDVANARAMPPAEWQMEQMTAQAQLQERAKSLETQEGMANLADAACLGSGLVTAIFGDTQGARDLRDAMRQGCKAGDAIRKNINNSLAASARQGSGVMQRTAPGDLGAAPVPASSR